MHSKTVLTFAAAAFALAAMPGFSFAQTTAQATFVSFDAPNGGQLSNVTMADTPLVAINIQGTIVTTYTDEIGTHALIRERNGHTSTFDVAGSSGTFASAINDSGAITGYYKDSAGVAHGFVATPKLFSSSYSNAAVVTFDISAASPLAPIPGTTPTAINNFGAVTGTYEDANGGIHSFLLLKDLLTNSYLTNRITLFDAPNASISFFAGTSANSINDFGSIGGTYTDINGNPQVFLRFIDGSYAPIAVPNSAGNPYTLLGGNYGSVNDLGEIAGNYFEPTSDPIYHGIVRGFVRTAFGSYQTFDAAISSPSPTFTYVTAINSAGEVTGYEDQGNAFHGYTRDVNGTITTFDAPGAALIPLHGTYPTSINFAGTVAGYYTDANGTNHGFIRTPPAGQ